MDKNDNRQYCTVKIKKQLVSMKNQEKCHCNPRRQTKQKRVCRSSITKIDNDKLACEPASVVLLVASQYVLPGYGDQRVGVRGPSWPDHCVRL